MLGADALAALWAAKIKTTALPLREALPMSEVGWWFTPMHGSSDLESSPASGLLAYLFLWGIVVLHFTLLADVASGCALSLIVVAVTFYVIHVQTGNRCLMRAALVIYVLGLLLLVVASVLLAMKAHRVTSLTPDPKCEPWAGSCQEGGQRSDGRTECSDCSDPSTCVDRSAAGLWWSEEGALYFPASEKDGKYWGWGRTRRLNGCGIPKEPRKDGDGYTDGGFGASNAKQQKRRWKAAKETGDCRPLFPSRAECEDYWERWQDAWRAEWRGPYVGLLFLWILFLLGNCAYVACSGCEEATEACRNRSSTPSDDGLPGGPRWRRPTSTLYLACEKGHFDAARLLLDTGADVNRADKYGMTPLYIACAKGHVNVARLLLDNGAAVDWAMEDGATPLYVACEKGHVNAARLLLDNGAEVDRAMETRWSTRTPLDIAKQRGHSAVVALLEAHRK